MASLERQWGLVSIPDIPISNLIRVKEGSEQVGLKLNIEKTKIMVSGTITSWQTEREKVEAVPDFIFWSANKITVDGDRSHEIKRRLLL